MRHGLVWDPVVIWFYSDICKRKVWHILQDAWRRGGRWCSLWWARRDEGPLAGENLPFLPFSRGLNKIREKQCWLLRQWIMFHGFIISVPSHSTFASSGLTIAIYYQQWQYWPQICFCIFIWIGICIFICIVICIIISICFCFGLTIAFTIRNALMV